MSEQEPSKVLPKHANPAFMSLNDYLLFRGTDQASPVNVNSAEFTNLLGVSVIPQIEGVLPGKMSPIAYGKAVFRVHSVHLGRSMKFEATGLSDDMDDPLTLSTPNYYSELKTRAEATLSTNQTEIAARGWFYIVNKFVTSPGYSEYFQALPDSRRIYEAVRLLRRDEFAQFCNTMMQSMDFLPFLEDTDPLFDKFDDHANWGYPDIKTALQDQIHIQILVNEDQVTTYIKIREAEAAEFKNQVESGVFGEDTPKQMYRLKVFENENTQITTSIIRALHFNRLYPSGSSERSKALSMIGVPEDFPDFTYSNFDVKMIPVILENFAYLNNPTDLMR